MQYLARVHIFLCSDNRKLSVSPDSSPGYSESLQVCFNSVYTYHFKEHEFSKLLWISLESEMSK